MLRKNVLPQILAQHEDNETFVPLQTSVASQLHFIPSAVKFIAVISYRTPPRVAEQLGDYISVITIEMQL